MWWIFLALSFASVPGIADCRILNTDRTVATDLRDVLFDNLSAQPTCPQSIFDLKDVLAQDGLTTTPSMVANRGFHNPKFGSFSFFEISVGSSKALSTQIKPGHFYFGHFTGANEGVVVLDHLPAPGKLLIELIAWDFTKELYNFYELIGTQTGGTWFYRGDSKDILEDLRFVHLQKDPRKPVFGKNLRCSGCHSSGGPIAKELTAPHDSWWTTARPLPLLPNVASENIKTYLANLMDAEDFATAVKDGIKLLEKSPTYQLHKSKRTLQEQLRPLFCTNEINLVSDALPLDGETNTVRIPSEYFMNPLLFKGDPISISKESYRSALVNLNFKFPEIQRRDADHAWLAPVKGHSDLQAIQALIDNELIDPEFVADVLSLDFSHPLFSPDRCALLGLVPRKLSADWEQALEKALSASTLPLAATLRQNLEDPAISLKAHQAKARLAYEKLQADLETDAQVADALARLSLIRQSVFDNEISKNPMGQILEPGFRVIFPVRRSF